jgi:hypothetical protein
MSTDTDDDWVNLNRAITDRSLDTASLCQLRRYFKAAHAQGVSVSPALLDNIQRLISRRESARQARWTLIGAWAAIIGAGAAIVAAVASMYGLWK